MCHRIKIVGMEKKLLIFDVRKKKVKKRFSRNLGLGVRIKGRFVVLGQESHPCRKYFVLQVTNSRQLTAVEGIIIIVEVVF